MFLALHRTLIVGDFTDCLHHGINVRGPKIYEIINSGVIFSKVAFRSCLKRVESIFLDKRPCFIVGLPPEFLPVLGPLTR